MNYTLREMTIKDYAAVFDLWVRTPGIGLHDDTDSWVGIEHYLVCNPGLSLVAEAEGRIVGAVLCGHDGRCGYLHHLAVADGYRGQGIARALVEKAMASLAMRGIPRCGVMTYADNLEGRKFWQRMGFRMRENLRILSNDTAAKYSEPLEQTI